MNLEGFVKIWNVGQKFAASEASKSVRMLGTFSPLGGFPQCTPIRSHIPEPGGPGTPPAH